MEDPELIWFRDLFDEILEYKRHTLFYDVLLPWIEKANIAIAELSRFRHHSAYDHRDEAAQAAMWNLYALSRVNDVLLGSFQSKPNDPSPKRQVAAEEYAAFFSQIGFTVVERNRYSPFSHEILRVHQSDNDGEPIGVLEQHWPLLMFGDMLFSRSGVEVIGGRQHVVKEIAEKSVMYFTFWRVNRKTFDRSKGWGHNSQWRTNFRRDYESKGKRFYNVDGRNSLNAPKESEFDQEDGLTIEQRIELCKNRCFVVTSADDDDLHPFHERFEEEMIL